MKNVTKHKLSRYCQVWFKNRRAKIRQLQKQTPKNPQANSTKKTPPSTTTATTTKLKVKSSTALLSSSAPTSENETGYCLKTQNSLTTLSGSSKVRNFKKIMLSICLLHFIILRFIHQLRRQRRRSCNNSNINNTRFGHQRISRAFLIVIFKGIRHLWNLNRNIRWFQLIISPHHRQIITATRVSVTLTISMDLINNINNLWWEKRTLITLE